MSEEWRVEAGFGSKESAQEMIRQTRAHFAKKGKRLRMRYEDEGKTWVVESSFKPLPSNWWGGPVRVP